MVVRGRAFEAKDLDVIPRPRPHKAEVFNSRRNFICCSRSHTFTYLIDFQYLRYFHTESLSSVELQDPFPKAGQFMEWTTKGGNIVRVRQAQWRGHTRTLLLDGHVIVAYELFETAMAQISGLSSSPGTETAIRCRRFREKSMWVFASGICRRTRVPVAPCRSLKKPQGAMCLRQFVLARWKIRPRVPTRFAYRRPRIRSQHLSPRPLPHFVVSSGPSGG